MVFLSNTSAVWLDDSGVPLLRFYDRDFSYDLVTGGCTVTLGATDPPTRTFDMTSPCLGDANSVIY
jgi:hypothetical protein